MLGIDVGKTELVCALYEPASERFHWERSFPNSPAGVQLLLEQTDPQTAWVMEPTGRFSQTVAAQARQAGRQVLLAPTRKAQAYLRSCSSRAKTDRVDGRGLALFGATRTAANPLRPYPLKSEPVEQLDQLLSARRGVVGALTALQQQRRQLPHAAAVLQQAVEDLRERRKELDRKIAALAGSELPAKRARKRVARAAEAAVAEAAPATRPVLAESTDGAPPVPPAGAAPSRATPFPLMARLLKVPGFGLVTAAALASRLTDREFGRADEFVAYVGLDVGVRQSGQRTGKGSLTKEGDADLRRLLFLAAASNVRSKDSPFRTQYERERAKGLPKIAALNAVARKLARVAWSLDKHGGDYVAERVHEQRPKRERGGPGVASVTGST